jgi:hypothetical protein
MGRLLVPRRFTQQPSNIPAIDGGNPLARGLVFYALPVGGVMIDLMTNLIGAPLGTTPPIIQGTPSGKVAKYAGGGPTASYSSFGTGVKALDLGSGPATYFFYLWQAPGVTWVGGIADKSDGQSSGLGGSSAGWQIYVTNDGYPAFDKCGSDPLYARYNYPNFLPPGQPCSLCITFDGTLPASSSDIVGYLNGINIGIGIGRNGTVSSITDAAYPLFLGTANNATSGGGAVPYTPAASNSAVECAAFYNRVLNATEVLALHNNHYQVLKAPSRAYYAPSPDLTLPLVGVSMTSSVGNMVPPLSGVVATSAAGTVAPTLTLALTGNALTSAPGTVGFGIGFGLVGVAATSSAGTMIGGYLLTGQSAAATPGAVVPSPSVLLAGQAATGSVGTVAPSRSAVLPGVSAVSAPGVFLPTNVLSVTGNSSATAEGTVTPSPSYSLQGVSAASTAGSMAHSLTLALTGAAITSAIGAVGPGVAARAVGVSAASAAGTAAPSTRLNPLAGDLATFLYGNLIPTGKDVTLPITGFRIQSGIGYVQSHMRLDQIPVYVRTTTRAPFIHQPLVRIYFRSEAVVAYARTIRSLSYPTR